MNNVLVRGYFALNVGDDLFLKILFEKYPKATFWVLSDIDSFAPFSHYVNVKVLISSKLSVFDRIINKFFIKGFVIDNYVDNILKQSNRIPKFDAVITIAGSLFMQGESTGQIRYSYLYDQLFLKLPNVKQFFLGCNFGPYSDINYRSQYSQIFNKAEDVCFRESYSAKLFPELNNVRVAPDIVFGARFPKVEQIEGSIGISVILPSLRKQLVGCDDSYYKKIAEVVEKGINENRKVRLFSFCEKEGDEKAISDILNLVSDSDKVEIVNYKGDLDGFMHSFSEMETMIATRFHAMILGFVLNQRVFPIVYSDKMSNVLEDLEYDNDYIRIENIDQLTYDRLKENSNKPILNIDKVREEAEKQFLALDREFANHL